MHMLNNTFIKKRKKENPDYNSHFCIKKFVPTALVATGYCRAAGSDFFCCCSSSQATLQSFYGAAENSV